MFYFCFRIINSKTFRHIIIYGLIFSDTMWAKWSLFMFNSRSVTKSSHEEKMHQSVGGWMTCNFTSFSTVF